MNANSLRVGPTCMDYRRVPRDWDTLCAEIESIDFEGERAAMEMCGVETEDLIQLRAAPLPVQLWHNAFLYGQCWNADWWCYGAQVRICCAVADGLASLHSRSVVTARLEPPR